MKIYISVDIEGVAGITHWDEARKVTADYAEFRERMTDEAVTACEAALRAGATEIWVKDAHGSGRNILAERLPAETRLIRGWSGHPYGMLQELDNTFDAVAMVGWHAPASHPANPLSHTLTGHYGRMTLNGVLCSEYLLHAHIAALEGVPVVFLSGDEGICALAQSVNPALQVVETNVGRGESVVGIHPAVARQRIGDTVQQALRGDLSSHVLPTANHYELRIRFKHHGMAYEKSFFPGARLDDDGETLVIESDDFLAVATALRFMS